MARLKAKPTAVKPRQTRGAALEEDVPYGMRIAAEWSWRFVIIVAGAGILIWLLAQVSFIIIPLMLAVLFSALLTPIVDWLTRLRLPRGLAVAVTLLGLLGVIVLTLIFVGREAISGFRDLWDEALAGVRQVQEWLQTGPLHLTTDQLDGYLKSAIDTVQGQSKTILTGAVSVGSSAGHIAAGSLLMMFVLVFFLLEGRRIWDFVSRFAPRKARPAVHGAGRKAWVSVGSYVRIQVFVAAVDAVGIGAGAAIIGVPLALPLGLAVFLGSFIPVVGALVTGAVAVLLALVANGLVNAIIMLVIVLAVQQIESHVLQPLVMGKAVALHPVGVILAVAAGSFLAGIPGALFAVPILAAINSVVRYIATRGWDNEPDPYLGGAYDPEAEPAKQSERSVDAGAASGTASGTAEGRAPGESTPPGTSRESTTPPGENTPDEPKNN